PRTGDPDCPPRQVGELIWVSDAPLLGIDKNPPPTVQTFSVNCLMTIRRP
ncbi:hypothetical protein AGABI1DRAFT_88319, partial [Agaricus bisporus var. burnettii JB137-S8]